MRRLSINGRTYSNKSEDSKNFTEEVQMSALNAVEEETASRDDSRRKRDKWAHPIEFLLALIGYSVGLGNIWRFPYVVMRNGGGAFLIPYLFFLALSAIPLCYMEFTLGQYTGLSPVRAFDFAPFFKGTGWAMLLVSGILCIYYNIVMAWVLYYFGMSFHWDLPWKHCNNPWNTPQCFSIFDNETNGTSLPEEMTTSTNEFWLYNVLEVSPDISVFGGINWKLFACMLAAWTATFLCLMKGIRTSGKVVYVTALLPYAFLTAILIRGVTLPGSWLGLQFYLRPDWSHLLNVGLWSNAAVQIFYSVGPAWGGLITMSSYNEVNRKYNRDAFLLPIISGATSIYGGIAIFSVIGHMVHSLGSTDVAAVMQSGPGLAFSAYPEALARLPGGAVWAVLFFAMLFTLGLDSQFGTLETMTSGLIDQFPSVLGRCKVFFTLGTCVVQFLLGLILVTRAGLYYFQVLDWYATPISVIIIAVMEIGGLSYVYGARRLLDNAESMLGRFHKFSRIWWLISWYGLVPIFTVGICLSIFIDYEPPAFTNGQPFPAWSIAFGWCIALISILPMPGVAVFELIKNRKQASVLFRPSEFWLKSVEDRHSQQANVTSGTMSPADSSESTEDKDFVGALRQL
uniref:Transporter n=1 Tax=Schistocephalus solidus TaxID=70667 RepID=A0A0X3NJA5_SCHSO